MKLSARLEGGRRQALHQPYANCRNGYTTYTMVGQHYCFLYLCIVSSFSSYGASMGNVSSAGYASCMESPFLWSIDANYLCISVKSYLVAFDRLIGS